MFCNNLAPSVGSREQVANVPVKFVQVPYVVLSMYNIEWTPRGVRWLPLIMQFPDIWQAMIWPIVGVVFWWMSGRGMEALFAARKRIERQRINLIELAFGLSFVIFGSALCAVLAFDSYSTERESMLAAGGGLWAILGTVLVLAFILQWRIRRRT